MPKATTKFERWIPHQPSTLSFQIFQQHNAELEKLWGTHITSSRFVYKTLGGAKASWSDSPSDHFDFRGRHWETYNNLREWSDSFNLFDNWINLSVVLTLHSNLETYMASVIALALESDPGLLLGASKKIDGTILLKHRTATFDYNEQIDSCTKGVWSSRLGALRRLFGSVPSDFSDQLRSLEQIRNIRNRVGHAFGRDIAAARKHGVRQILPMEVVSRSRAERYRDRIWTAAKALDRQLITTHIGEFKAVRFYHYLYPKLHTHVPLGQRAMSLKKEIGKFGVAPRGKIYCKGLVDYYEAL
jgi:hypothetical protein